MDAKRLGESVPNLDGRVSEPPLDKPYVDTLLRASGVSQVATPPCCEHVPLRCLLNEYVPSRQRAVVPLGAEDGSWPWAGVAVRVATKARPQLRARRRRRTVIGRAESSAASPLLHRDSLDVVEI